MRQLRGKEIGFIFQDPLTSLNPTLTIGYQIAEAIRAAHGPVAEGRPATASSSCSAKVGIPRAKDRLNDYPYQFSGGMRQRVMIAIALSCDPKLILADEPTTALDVTIQAQILELIQRLSDEFHTAVLLITHDLGIAAGHVRPGQRHVRRPDRRDRHRRRAVREPADALRVGPARLAAAARRRPRRPAADDRGPAAAAHRRRPTPAGSSRAAGSPGTSAARTSRS